jgi:hypothetical protein
VKLPLEKCTELESMGKDGQKPLFSGDCSWKEACMNDDDLFRRESAIYMSTASFGTVPCESPIGLSCRSPALAVKLLGSTSHPIM